MNAIPMSISEAFIKAREYAYYDIFSQLITPDIRSTIADLSIHEEIPSAQKIKQIIHKDSSAFLNPIIMREIAYGLTSVHNEVINLIAQVQKNAIPHVITDKFTNYLRSSLHLLESKIRVRCYYDPAQGQNIDDVYHFPNDHTHVSYYLALATNFVPENFDIYSFAILLKLCVVPIHPTTKDLIQSMIDLSMDALITGDQSIIKLQEFQNLTKDVLNQEMAPSDVVEKLALLFDDIFAAWLIGENA